jgi:transketolase
VTVEEHTIEGGLGSIVVEALARRRVPTPVFTHGLQDEFALIGPPSHLYRYYGLDADGVATVAHRALADDADPRHPLWTDADRQEVLATAGARRR